MWYKLALQQKEPNYELLSKKINNPYQVNTTPVEDYQDNVSSLGNVYEPAASPLEAAKTKHKKNLLFQTPEQSLEIARTNETPLGADENENGVPDELENQNNGTAENSQSASGMNVEGTDQYWRGWGHMDKSLEKPQFKQKFTNNPYV